MDRVADLRHFGEHDGAARPDDEVRRVADRRVRGDARERVAAAALDAHDQVGGGAGLPPPAVEPVQPFLGHPHQDRHHVAEAVEGFILEEQYRRSRAFPAIPATRAGRFFRHQPVGLELLAAEADDHRFSAEVRVEDEVPERPDRHGGPRGVDGDAAAVAVVDRHDVVDVRVAGEQLVLDAADQLVRPRPRRTARWSICQGGSSCRRCRPRCGTRRR